MTCLILESFPRLRGIYGVFVKGTIIPSLHIGLDGLIAIRQTDYTEMQISMHMYNISVVGFLILLRNGAV